MKKCDAVYMLISILEGLLSGGYFYLAKKEKEPLNILTGCVWLACSVFHGMISLRAAEDDDTILLEETEDV